MVPDGQLSPSGVWIANDFRSNLIIDRAGGVASLSLASRLPGVTSAD